MSSVRFSGRDRLRTYWYSLLEDPSITQTRNAMRTSDNCYCALGLLAKAYIVMRPGEFGWEYQLDSKLYALVRLKPHPSDRWFGPASWTSYPPEEILQAAEIDDGARRIIARMNDEERLTLPEIAAKLRLWELEGTI